MKMLCATIERESDETLDDIQDQLKDNVEDLHLECEWLRHNFGGCYRE